MRQIEANDYEAISGGFGAIWSGDPFVPNVGTIPSGEGASGCAVYPDAASGSYPNGPLDGGRWLEGPPGGPN